MKLQQAIDNYPILFNRNMILSNRICGYCKINFTTINKMDVCEKCGRYIIFETPFKPKKRTKN